jgi:hypothetical protein
MNVMGFFDGENELPFRFEWNPHKLCRTSWSMLVTECIWFSWFVAQKNIFHFEH